MTRNPLLLPEILANVAPSLSLGDLTSCVRVSRAWHHVLEPFLYTTVPLGFGRDDHRFSTLQAFDKRGYISTRSPPWAKVAPHIRRIRQLRVLGLAALETLPVHLMSHFQLVELSICEYEPELITPLLMHNAGTLRSLTCQSPTAKYAGVLKEKVSQFWTTLATSLVHLEHLHVCGFWISEEDDINFSTVCARLSSLSLREFSAQAHQIRPTAGCNSFTRMKRLELWDFRTGQIRYLLPLIELCRNLECLIWTGCDIRSVLNNIPPFKLVVDYLASREHIQEGLGQITSLQVTGESSQLLARMIGDLPRLQKLTTASFGRRCCEQVLLHLRDTLEELDLSSCPRLPTSITQVILLTCRKLKRFKARNFHASVLDRRPHDLENISNRLRLSNNYTDDDDDDARYSDEDEDEERELTWHLLTSLNSPGQSQVSPPPFDSIRNWTWACTSLEELELHVKSPGGHSDTNVATFLTQLSELTNLQRLILGWSSDIRQLPSDSPNEFASAEARLDLTLRGSGGGLAKLHTLTRLKYFDVQSIDLLDMDTDDFRWMGTHWTSLRTVRTSWVNDEDKSKEIKIRHLLLNEFPHIALYRPEPSH